MEPLEVTKIRSWLSMLPGIWQGRRCYGIAVVNRCFYRKGGAILWSRSNIPILNPNYQKNILWKLEHGSQTGPAADYMDELVQGIRMVDLVWQNEDILKHFYFSGLKPQYQVCSHEYVSQAFTISVIIGNNLWTYTYGWIVQYNFVIPTCPWIWKVRIISWATSQPTDDDLK